MNRIKIIIVVSVWLQLSCCSNTSNYSGNKCINSQKTINSVNSFDEFIKEFSEDTCFQLSSIKFPVIYTFSSPDDEGGAIETSKIYKKEWKIINLIDKDGFEEAVEISKSIKDTNTIEISVKGVDTGLSISYSFEKVSGKWYLIRIIDHSN